MGRRRDVEGGGSGVRRGGWEMGESVVLHPWTLTAQLLGLLNTSSDSFCNVVPSQMVRLYGGLSRSNTCCHISIYKQETIRFGLHKQLAL